MAKLSAAEIAGYAKHAGFTGANLAIAVAVALAESGGNTEEVGGPNEDGSRDFGLWQINDKAWPDLVRGGTWSSPRANAEMAYYVYKKQGWNAWYSYKNKSTEYQKALPGAMQAAGNPAGVSAVEGLPAGGVEGLPDVQAGLGDALKYAAKTTQWIADPHNWTRVLWVAVGGGLVLAAIGKVSGVQDMAKAVR